MKPALNIAFASIINWQLGLHSVSFDIKKDCNDN